jgi:hypothetical protein
MNKLGSERHAGNRFALVGFDFAAEHLRSEQCLQILFPPASAP